MKTVLDESTRVELIDRISALQETAGPLWGRMTVYQMVRHCTLWDNMVLQNKTYKRPLIGRLLGRIMLKKEMRDDTPMKPGNPSIPELIVSAESGDLAAAKAEWIGLIRAYAEYAVPDYSFIHPFFGKMSREQIGYFAYKHTDHHLRQFQV